MFGFEPNPGGAKIIQQKLDAILAGKIGHTGSAKTIAAGVSSEPGTMTLNVRKGAGGGVADKVAGSSFAYGGAGKDVDANEYEGKSVR